MEKSKINLNDKLKKKETIYKLNKREEDIKNFNTELRLKSTLLNIDSTYREKIPRNIVKSTSNILSSNPINVTKDSIEVKIYYPNHTFKISDKIIIQNVDGNSKILTSILYLFSNFDYIVVKMENHGITSDYLTYIDDFKVNIEVLDDLEDSDRLIGNIPLNSFLGPQKIYHASKIEIPDLLYTYLGISESKFPSDYFFIKLPYNYSPSIPEDIFKQVDKIIKLTFMNIGGIPTTFLNANYPVNYNQYQGYQEITKIETDYIYFNSKMKAYKDETSGGNKIQLSYIIDTLPGYPESNEYTISLKKNFNDVARIELVSTEIPFLDFLVKSNGKNKNNKLYWQHLDDGNYTYEIEIPEGNYDGSNLIKNISESMNNLKRIGYTLSHPIYNLFEISFNTYSQKIEFVAFKEEFVPESITINTVIINNESFYKLTVSHPQNLVEVNDVIVISDAEKVDQIPANSINGSHTVYEINKNAESYSVLLSNINLSDTTGTGNGGNSIKIKTRALVRFLFNKSDTCGKIIGFKNVGEKNAITNFSHITSNFDDYIFDTNFNEVGNLDLSNDILNVTGDNMYLLMHLNDYECIVSNTNVSSCFAKILLTGTPGDIQFNTFINHPMEFDIPISTLSELRVKFTFPDGSLPDFRNLNNSFTLRIVEQISVSRNTGINSKKTNHLETMKEIVNNS